MTGNGFLASLIYSVHAYILPRGHLPQHLYSFHYKLDFKFSTLNLEGDEELEKSCNERSLQLSLFEEHPGSSLG